MLYFLCAEKYFIKVLFSTDCDKTLPENYALHSKAYG